MNYRELMIKQCGTSKLFFDKSKGNSRFDVLISLQGLIETAERSGDKVQLTTSIRRASAPYFSPTSGWSEVVANVATATVVRNGRHPITVELSEHEYFQTNYRGVPSVQWKLHGRELLERIAAAHAIRRAYGIGAIYIPEEVGVGMVNNNGRLIIDRIVGTPSITADQVADLELQFAELEVNRTGFLDYFGIVQVADLAVRNYREALRMLNKKREIKMFKARAAAKRKEEVCCAN